MCSKYHFNKYKAVGLLATMKDVGRADAFKALSLLILRLKFSEVRMWQWFEIEINSYCNRDCVFCPRHEDRSGVRKDAEGIPVKKMMPTDKVYSLINEAVGLGYRGRIGFQRLSEPFLDERYLDFYRYARSKGLMLYDFTNGDVLRRETELCGALDEQGNTLVIGLYDSITEEQENREKKFWKKKFRKANILFSNPLMHNLRIRQGSGLYGLADKNEKIFLSPCRDFFEGLLVRYDGNVDFCCQDVTNSFSIGNVFKSSLDKIWWSAKRRDIIDALSRPGGRRDFSLCSACHIEPDTSIVNPVPLLKQWGVR